jgi:hypothetical protein
MIVHRVVLRSGKTPVGYEFRKLERSGKWAAHKDGVGTPYLVNLTAKTCTCAAGRNGRLCKHRTKAAELEGLMSDVKKTDSAAPLAVAGPEDRTLALARILTRGDIGGLTEGDRATYYLAVCDACELNPASRPFEFILVRGKTGPRTILYATKAATEQLRKRDRVSLAIVSQKEESGLYVVTVEASLPDGRKDIDIGAAPVGTGAHALQGEDRANAVMKAVTKAKRRATLSICGLGMLDESEIESLPVGAATGPVTAVTTPARQPEPPKPVEGFDRLGALQEIDAFAARLKIDPAKFQKGLESAYGKSVVQGLLDAEIADLHKRLSAKLAPQQAA